MPRALHLALALGLALASWPGRADADGAEASTRGTPRLGDVVRLERGNVLWLIVSNDPAAGEPAGYRLVQRQSGGGWEGRWRSGPGAVTATAALGDALFLVFSGGSIARYDVSGEASPVLQPGPELWPADTRALAASAYGNDALLMLVNRPKVERRPQPTSRPASTQAASLPAGTQPASSIAVDGEPWPSELAWNVPPATRTHLGRTMSARPRATAAGTAAPSTNAAGNAATTSGPATRPTRYAQMQSRRATFPVLRELALLVYRAGQWTELAVLDEAALNWTTAGLRARAQAVYVLLQRPGAASLLHWDGSESQHVSWQQIALPADLSPDSIFALLLTQWMSGGETPTLAALPQAGRVLLQRYSTEEGWKRAEVALPGAQAPIAAAGAAAMIDLAWLHEGIQHATLSGDQLLEGPGPVIVQPTLSAGEVWRLWQVFIGVLLAAAVVLIFLPGQVPRTAPFSLPEDMPPARLSRRFAAAMLDGIMVAFVGSVLFLFLDIDPNMDLKQRMPAQAVYLSLGVMVGYIAYGTLLECFLGGTLGKLLLGLRVVGDRGRRPTLRETALRNVSKLPELATIFAIIPILFPLFSRYRQRLGDWIAWTAVVEAKAWRVPNHDDSAPPSEPDHDKL